VQVCGVFVATAAEIPTSRKEREKWGTLFYFDFTDLALQFDGEDVEQVQHFPSQQKDREEDDQNGH
jgi:hypothetical protein